MTTLKILLLSFCGAILLGMIVGALWGRYLRKREENTKKPVFSPLQKIMASVSVLVGLALIVTGALLPPKMDTEDFNGLENGMEQGDEMNGEPASPDTGGEVAMPRSDGPMASGPIITVH